MGCASGKLKIVAMSGSLRGASCNTGLLNFLKGLPSQFLNFDIQFVGFLPLYNEDLEKEKKIPAAVFDLREKVRQADAIIFASPQYNGSVSGVLKNAFDWLSRDYSKMGQKTSPLLNKKCGLVSASYVSKKQIADIHRMGEYSKMQFPKEDYYVNLAQKPGPFDQNGCLISEEQKKKLEKWMAQFAVFVTGSVLPPATQPVTK